jgi:hypothetical protein
MTIATIETAPPRDPDGHNYHWGGRSGPASLSQLFHSERTQACNATFRKQHIHTRMETQQSQSIHTVAATSASFRLQPLLTALLPGRPRGTDSIRQHLPQALRHMVADRTRGRKRFGA